MWVIVTVRNAISFYIITKLFKYFADQVRDPEMCYREGALNWREEGAAEGMYSEMHLLLNLQYTGRNFLCMLHHNRVYYGVQGRLIFHLSNSLLIQLGSDSQRDELNQKCFSTSGQTSQ